MTTLVLHEDKSKKVTTGYLRLKGDTFTEDNLVKNRHQLSLDEKVSYPTLLRYLDASGKDITTFNGDVLYAILVTGLGNTPEELANMKIGDVFDIVKRDGR